jgi:hypothetical protein
MVSNRQSAKLSNSCTVLQYRDFESRNDRNAIAAFVEARFAERYLDPLEVFPERKSGFAIMAVTCLMIEALESFALGWADSRHKSKRVFRSFFVRWDEFAAFRPLANDFYIHIRCGILHQAETTDGWRIRRDGSLIGDRVINATKFAKVLRRVLSRYASLLRTEPWDSEIWTAFRKKMNHVCRNTERN